MPRRVDRKETAPRKPTARALPAKWVPGTATPCGWSFYALWQQCPRAWFYKYYLGRKPTHVARWLTFGTVYHALHEGVSEVQIVAAGEPWSTHLPEAKRLYDFRVKAGLPEKVASEELSVVRKGPLRNIYTAAVDRREADGGREFKCLADVRDTAEDEYKTHGEVLGELLASDLPKITVDIITKSKAPQIKQIPVRRDDPVTEKKITAFERQIEECAEKIRDVVGWADSFGVREEMARPLGPAGGLLDSLDVYFPQRFGDGRCVAFGDICPHYDVCWANGEEQAARLFTTDASTQRWRDYLMK